MLSIISFYIFLTSLFLCTILVPFVARLSVRIGGLDTPDERKIHTQIVPRLGGIAIFAALIFTIIFFCDIDQQLKGLLSGAIIIFLTGLADDLSGLTPRQKFAGEFLAAGLAVFMGGIVVRHLGNPFGLGTIELGLLSTPFTILGIVGLINAINLLDGLDGLAGGVCSIACISFAILSYLSGNLVLFSLTLALLGALLGFLRYNSFPATIFMGDSGSLLLGYCMGCFSVMLASGGALPVSPYVPLLVLGVPILDTLVVMVNRKLHGKHLFLPDRTHLHHRLLDLEIGHKFTVLIVFGITYLLNMVAIFGCNLNADSSLSLSDSHLLLLLLVSAALMYGIVYYLSLGGGRSLGNWLLFSDVSYRNLLRGTVHLSSVIKVLLAAILLPPVMLTQTDDAAFLVVPIVLLLLSIIVVLTRWSWNHLLLQAFLYGFSVLLIFALENFGRGAALLGVPLLTISDVLFVMLLIAEGIKILIRKRTSFLIFSPFEYLIMLIVLTVPLLPEAVVEPYNLLMVAAKSVVMFVGFKLVLVRQVKRNRKFILAIMLSMLVMVVFFLWLPVLTRV